MASSDRLGVRPLSRSQDDLHEEEKEMSEEERRQEYRSKDEKQEKQEKEEEKQEKSWDEKWRRDPINAAAWAVILIWGGLVLLAGNLGLFDRFEAIEGWDIFFLGAGVILLLEVVFRLLAPAYRQPIIGNMILAIVFLAIGLGNLVNWGIIWGLAIIAIGIYLLLGGARRRRQ